MIGNISFGISFENGKRRVPIPPAVIKAVYPSKPFDDPVSSIDSMVRPLTRGVPNRWRGTRPTSTSCFQLGYNNGYVRCFEHMRIHGEYVPNVLPSRERTIWGGAGSLGASSPGRSTGPPNPSEVRRPAGDCEKPARPSARGRVCLGENTEERARTGAPDPEDRGIAP